MKMKKATPAGALLRKDIFRFAPLWGIYLIGGLLVMLSTLSNNGDRAAMNLASTMGPFSIINMIYAGLVAQMLFGDLYNTRLCYALHALPMRRETWFLTHVASGLLYSFVPHLIAAVCFTPLMGQFGFVAWAWLLAMVLEYLFFFGLAVLCAMCVGNRFAALATYTIVNFASLIAYWFVDTLYAPFLYGIVIPDEIFALLCPVVQMVSNNELLKLDGEWAECWYGEEYVVTYEGIGEGWGYLAICACVGAVLLGVALLLYRRRKLESAGDFIAVKLLEPIFAVVFTLCVGCALTLFGDVFGTNSGPIFFLVGLFIGWFGGQMLLQRTVKVFKGKAFLRLLILVLALAGTVAVTALDPLGVTTYVPEADQVTQVKIGVGTSPYSIGEYYELSDSGIRSTDEGTIEAVVQLHQQILRDGERDNGGRRYTILYTLKSGRQVARTYTIYRDTKSWDMLAVLFNNPERILGFGDKQAFMEAVNELDINGGRIEDLKAAYDKKFSEYPDAKEFDAEKAFMELKEAIWADCAAGTMNSEFYEDKFSEYYISAWWQNGRQEGYRSWAITSRMENCQAWLEEYADLLNMLGSIINVGVSR